MTEKHGIYMACAVVLIGLICVMPALAAETGRIAFESNMEGNYEIYVMNPDGTNVTRLTNNPGSDFSPEWSPDGSRIAFISGREGNTRDIFVMNEDGTEQTRLTKNAVVDSKFTWSPDGSRIAFSDSLIIFVMNADGTNLTRLTNSTTEGVAIEEFGPTWSPDGSRITFISDRDSNPGIYMMDPDGTNVTRQTNSIASDSEPDWSPDGSRIAFRSERDGNPGIYVMNWDGTNVTRLTNNSQDIVPVWSPDGYQIAFASYRNGNSDVYVMNGDGTGQTRLTNNAGRNSDPSWGKASSALPAPNFTANVTTGPVPLTVRFTDTSPGSPTAWSWNFGDGTNSTEQNPIHTYTVAGSYTVNLTVKNSNGTDRTTKTGFITVNPTTPPVGSFSADITSGRAPLTIQFTDTSTNVPTGWSWSFGDGTNSTERNPIHRYTTVGTYTVSLRVRNSCSAVTVTKAGFITITPPDSAEMRRIAFTSWRDGKPEIYVMDEDGTNVTRLTNTRDPALYPAWSPDGFQIAFESDLENGGSDIYVMNADGTGQTRLDSGTEPVWSPDSSKIAFGSPQGIYVMNANGTGKTRLDSGTEPAWSPDSSKIAFGSPQGIYVMNANGTGLTSLTNGSDFSPAWSPDGSRIAFISLREGNNYQIYVMNADGTNMTRLTKNDDSNFYPAWSPDGARIAFSSLQKEGGSPEIFLMDADGTNMTRLTYNDASDTEPVWSPDGSRIAFTSTRFGSTGINVMNADGHGQTNLTSRGDTDPSWGRVRPAPAVPIANFTANITSGRTPLSIQFTDTSTGLPNSWEWDFGDGKTSAEQNPVHRYNSTGTYTVSLRAGNITGARSVTKTNFITVTRPVGKILFDNSGQIYMMNGDGTNVTRLTENSAHDSDPVWSTDSSRIAFISDRDGNNEIYVMKPDGTGQTRLTNNTAGESGPVWSPDDSRIAFISNRDGNNEVYVMNADGTGQTRLTNSTAGESGPAWSPDGSRIAFESNQDGNYETYVMNADGTGKIDLTSKDTGDNAGPAWSPDGSRIALIMESKSVDYILNQEIYVMKPDGTGQTPLTDKIGYISRLAWSPDGSKIAFVSTMDVYHGDFNDAICVMNADGTNVNRLTSDTNSYITALVWSPDGSQIAYANQAPQYDEGMSMLYAMNADGTGKTNLAPPQSSDILDISWGGEVSPTPAVPAATFTANVTDGTAPLTVQFTDTSTGLPNSWSWTFGDGANSTDQNPSHRYTTAGTYTVSLKIGTSAGPVTVTKTRFINVTPPASAGLIPIQGLSLMPADIDHDGLYEDLNGNGAPDFDDAAIFFNQMDWIASNEPINAFDFNHNGQIDFNDAVRLFNEL